MKYGDGNIDFSSEGKYGPQLRGFSLPAYNLLNLLDNPAIDFDFLSISILAVGCSYDPIGRESTLF